MLGSLSACKPDGFSFFFQAEDGTRDIGVTGVQTCALPISVEAVPGLPAGVHFSPLLFSSQKSWLAPAQPYASVSPTAIPTPRRDDPHGPYTVGGALEGTFTSYFQGKPIPVPGQTLIGTSPKTSIVVLGTARLLDPAL